MFKRGVAFGGVKHEDYGTSDEMTELTGASVVTLQRQQLFNIETIHKAFTGKEATKEEKARWVRKERVHDRIGIGKKYIKMTINFKQKLTLKTLLELLKLLKKKTKCIEYG